MISRWISMPRLVAMLAICLLPAFIFAGELLPDREQKSATAVSPHTGTDGRFELPGNLAGSGSPERRNNPQQKTAAEPAPWPNLAKPAYGRFELPRSHTGPGISEERDDLRRQTAAPPPPSPDLTKPAGVGEDIASADPIDGLPFFDSWSTEYSYVDDYDETCGGGSSTSPDVVYSFTPDIDTTITIDLCNSYYNTKLFVYENEYTPGAPYACNEDFCGMDGNRSALHCLPVAAGNTYYIVVDGRFGESGYYYIQVDYCVLDWPGCGMAAGPEGEPCAGDVNGGCNSAPEIWGEIFDGEIICGTAWAETGTRDTDWYKVFVGNAITSWSVRSNFQAQMFVLDLSSGCGSMSVLDYTFNAPGEQTTITVGPLPFGIYALWVGPAVYDNYQCPDGPWEYQATFNVREELLHVFDPEGFDENYAYSASGAGDLDGDGYDDIIVGAYFHDELSTHAGRVYVYSGQSGNLLWTTEGEAAVDYFGDAVAGAGNVDNQLFDDVVVGAPYNDEGGDGAGKVYVLSWPGFTVFTVTGTPGNDGYPNGFGAAVAGAGDVNNDGFADIIVGEPHWEPGYGSDDYGRAHVYSGQTHAKLYTFEGEAEDDYFGDAVSSAGDMNNDGFDDVIIGADGHNGPAGNNSGRAYVYSGQNGELLYQFDGVESYDRVGASVSAAGNVNNDEYDDVIVGASGYATGAALVFLGGPGPYPINRTAADADLILQAGDGDGGFGRSVSGVGDIDNDGFDDLLVGAGYSNLPGGGTNAGRAKLYSGLTGNRLYTLSGGGADDRFGSTVSGAGDVDNDGVPDLLVAAPGYGMPGYLGKRGQAYVFSLADVEFVSCECGTWGDVNDDFQVNPVDVVYMVNYVYKNQDAREHPPNCPYEAGDVDCNEQVNPVDVVFFVNKVYKNQDALCEPCG